MNNHILKRDSKLFKICRGLKEKYSRYFVSDSSLIKRRFKKMFNRDIDLDNPKTFNEKLQWLKLYDRKPEYTKMVDKFEVREYISKSIGEEYLVPLLGVWDNFDDIDFTRLPSQFVLKCTHDSGGLIICMNKSLLDINNARRKINKSMKRNYYYHSREWPYKNVKPRIICEKYINDNSATEIKDYKFMCFNGKVKCSFLCSNRNSKSGLKIDVYDREWNLMPFSRLNKKGGIKVDKPINYNKMIELAEELSKDIPFLRVDLYEVNKKVYFGELTFYPASGFEKFEPEEYDYILGEWLKLPKYKF